LMYGVASASFRRWSRWRCAANTAASSSRDVSSMIVLASKAHDSRRWASRRAHVSVAVVSGIPCRSHCTAASAGGRCFHRTSVTRASARCSRSERSTVGHCSCRRSAHRYVHSSVFMVGSGIGVHRPSIVAKHWMDVQYQDAARVCPLSLPVVRCSQLPATRSSRPRGCDGLQRAVLLFGVLRHVLRPYGLARTNGRQRRRTGSCNAATKRGPNTSLRTDGRSDPFNVGRRTSKARRAHRIRP